MFRVSELKGVSGFGVENGVSGFGGGCLEFRGLAGFGDSVGSGCLSLAARHVARLGQQQFPNPKLSFRDSSFCIPLYMRI